MEIKTWELDPNFKYEIAEQPGGENITYCFQCSTCTLGCPITEIIPSYNPRKIIQMSLLGMRKEVLSSDEIWICAICQTCSERCPQDVRISDLMGAIRRIAEKEAEEGKIEIKSVRPIFDKAFMHQVEKYGRSYEMGLSLEYYRKVHKGLIASMMAMRKDYGKLGMRLFKKGKMGPKSMLPEKIKRRNEIKRIFEKIGD
ncbi:MAG: 4Fe-4S dicluster domain-containing protein [Candidatus Syntropharchaeia archaeon]